MRIPHDHKVCQCVVVCCRVVQCVTVCCSVAHSRAQRSKAANECDERRSCDAHVCTYVHTCVYIYTHMQIASVSSVYPMMPKYVSVLQCVLQCVAVCCSVLQSVTVYRSVVRGKAQRRKAELESQSRMSYDDKA